MTHSTPPLGWRLGALTVYSDARPALANGAPIGLSFREDLVLRALTAAEGGWVPATSIEAQIGLGLKTPLKITLSTLRAALHTSGAPKDLIARGRNGAYRLTKKPTPLYTDPHTGDPLAAFQVAFDPVSRRLTGPTGEVALSPGEAALFAALLGASPRLVSTAQLARDLSADPSVPLRAGRVTSLVWHVRRAAAKIGAPNLIQTRAKAGYRIAPPL